MLNPQRLRIFREVASRGSFSAAADSLSYTQSAVSQSVAALEAEMGVTLLERDRRGARPTSAGEALVAHADAILAQLDAAEAEVAAIAGLRGGQLAMASFPTAGATIMPLAVATFRAAHPEVTLSLAEGEPEEIAPRLRAGEFDLALLFEFDGVSEGLGSGLRRIDLLEDPMYLALPNDHRLVDVPRIRLAGPRGRVVGADVGRKPLRPPRCPFVPRRGIRAQRLIRDRRLPDRPGAGRRRRRRRADPPAGALKRARRHRDQVPAPPGTGSHRDRGHGA